VILLPSLPVKAAILLLLMSALFAHSAYAQYMITVRDRSSGMPIEGATVSYRSNLSGQITDSTGKIKIPRSVSRKEDLRISMVGYIPFSIRADSIFNRQIELQAITTILQEVVVMKSRINNIQMGDETVTALEAKSLPAVLGEVDIIKVLQLKPGVKSAGEGLAGFYVRGGGADQNLVRLDGVPIYNANHLLGLFSIFNNDAIQDAKLYKSAYPAEAGGRLSSVLDVTSKKADMDSFHISGGVGLLSSRLSAETPIKKGKSSIIVCARRTYLDPITNSINNMNKGKEDYKPIPGYFFSEYNLRSDWKINARNSAWATAYLGSDRFNSDTKDYPAKFSWGNSSASFNWRSLINDNTSVTSSIFYSGYKYTLGNGFGLDNAEVHSGIRTLGTHITVRKTTNFFRSTAGIDIMDHKMTIGDYTYASSMSNLLAGEKTGGTEWAVFAGTEWDQNKKFALAGGLRLSGFIARDKQYINPEPRLSARFGINQNSALKASYTRMYQYLHLASLSSISLPVDIWYPTTAKTKPEYADQLSLGYSRSVGKSLYLNVEGYYKWMNNQVEFGDGANLIGNPKVENDFVYGKADAYGIETCLEKKTGRTRGWIGYTLSWVTRTFDDINDGVPFKPRYDRKHDISIVVMHRINNTFSLSFNWIYGSGAYTTLPVGRYVFQNESGVVPRSIIPVFKGRNNYQLQPVHRLDINLVTRLKSKKGQQDITFSLYNAYSRRNPFYVEYEETGHEGYVTSILPKVVSLFPVLPGITYNFKF
jgi:hypothetical protein